MTTSTTRTPGRPDRRKITNPPGLYNPVPHAYSFAASVPGEIVFLAGHWASDTSGQLAASGFRDQVALTLRNLGVTLAAEGLDFTDIVKLTAFVVGHDDEALDAVIGEEHRVWGERPPAQSLVPVPRLALEGMRFELEAVAVRPPLI